jgi:hypothetical protein
MKKISRRNIIKAAGMVSAGCMVGFITKPEKEEGIDMEVPWKFHPLEIDKSAQITYDQYPGNGCMYAVCFAVLTQLGEKYGPPYNMFPLKALAYGTGGVGSYGTLCGALNGAALLMGLFCQDRKERDTMIGNLFKWYELTEMPIFVPGNSKFPDEIPMAATNSVICHASITAWCKKAEVGPNDPLRIERCRRISADVAVKTLEILEDYINHDIKPFHLTASEKDCMGCHGSEEAKMLQSKTHMSCGSCHPNPHNKLSE